MLLPAPPHSARDRAAVVHLVRGELVLWSDRLHNFVISLGFVRAFVFVEHAPGVLLKTPVTLALRGRDTSYVGEGLSAGQRVVTKGALLLDAELATDR